jgi:hypothetical protein
MSLINLLLGGPSTYCEPLPSAHSAKEWRRAREGAAASKLAAPDSTGFNGTARILASLDRAPTAGNYSLRALRVDGLAEIGHTIEGKGATPHPSGWGQGDVNHRAE